MDAAVTAALCFVHPQQCLPLSNCSVALRKLKKKKKTKKKTTRDKMYTSANYKKPSVYW